MKLKLLVLLPILLFLSGCIGYDLEPKFNKETKILKIEDYEILGVKEIGVRHPVYMGSGSFTYNIKNYISDNTCKRIHYYNMSAGQNSYIISNLEEKIKDSKYVSCDVTKIGNLLFHSCINKKNNRNFYKVNASISNQFGYSDVKKLTLSKTCFDDMKEHFINKAIKDKIEITTYSIHKDKKLKKTKKYVGTSAEESNNKRCAKEANIVAYIIDEKITGNLSFRYNGKKVNRQVRGKVENDEFYGETNRIKFYGDFNKNSDEIKGEYFGKVCKGTFKLKLDATTSQ